MDKLGRKKLLKLFNTKFKSLTNYIKEVKTDIMLQTKLDLIEEMYTKSNPAMLYIFLDNVITDDNLSKQIKERNYEFFINSINDEGNVYKDNDLFKELYSIFRSIKKEFQLVMMDKVNDLRKIAIYFDRA